MGHRFFFYHIFFYHILPISQILIICFLSYFFPPKNFYHIFFYHISKLSIILIIFFYHIFRIISYFFKLGSPVEIIVYNLWLSSLQPILSRYTKQERRPPRCSYTNFAVQEFRHTDNDPKLKFAHHVTHKNILNSRKSWRKILDSSFLASFCSYDE